MLQIVNTLKTIAALFPIIVQIVKSVEEAIPDKGAGALKLELVKNTLKDTYATLDSIDTTFDQIWPIIQNLIASIVSAYNSLGKFRK